MDLVGLLISVISGAVGGNIAGAAMQDKSLGTLGNSIAGVLGGGAGGAVLKGSRAASTSPRSSATSRAVAWAERSCS